MLADVLAVTPTVFTLKVPRVFPAGIETVVGTLTADWLPESDTVNPPAGATELSSTTAVPDWPPFSELGVSVSEVNFGEVTERAACRD